MNLDRIAFINPTYVLDVGSNTGEWSKECKRIWPNCQTYMVEANPACEPYLVESGFPYQLACLSDSEKEVTFYQRKCGGPSTGDSYLREITPWYDDENLVQTKMWTTTLDEIFKFRSILFDFCKLDSQGSELDILRGGVKTISECKFIQMEVAVAGAKPYNLGAPTHAEVMSYMGSIGFKPVMELESIVHPLERYEIQKDWLFARE